MKKNGFDLSAASLHILAMATMVLDHMWATVVPGNTWMTLVGRLTFPIFAFLIAEGLTHTRDAKAYRRRMLVAAILSEIPFNLMCASSPIYPFHQNVLWTFLIAMYMIAITERAKERGSGLWAAAVGIAAVILGMLLGTVAMVDYFGAGVAMVMLFYFARGRRWYHFALQAAGMYYLNVEMLKGLYYPVTLFGHEFEFYQQSLALLALIPIWLYRGRQGYHSKAFRFVCYAFYPVHMLILAAVRAVM
jgi:hypothetical protein